MREIKFEAWDSRNNEMLSWTDINKQDMMGAMPFLDMLENQDRFKIRQYTGLKDKNGKEIYEGDIVRWGHLNEYSRETPDRVAIVKINPDIQYHAINLNGHIFRHGSFAYADTTERDLEVIGNIYEDGDLLNGEQHESES